MKRFFSFAAVLAALLLPHAAFAALETVSHFSVDATLASDRRLVVTETITYDFADNERHGIYRDIPVAYQRSGANYNLRIQNVSVTQDGQPAILDVSRAGGKMHIRIGDPDNTLTGVHVYTITYDNDRAINFSQDGSELYWNVTGNEWTVPIVQSDFTLHLPAGAASNTKTVCYTGAEGSTEVACTITSVEDGVKVASTRLLGPEEGLTIIASMPQGVITAPTTQEKIMMFLRDNGVLGIPIAAFILMAALWWTRGRDPGVGTIIPLYEPPRGQHPAEMSAALENGTVSERSVTATIIDMARRGYLHIRYGEKKGLLSSSQTFTFVKTKPADAALLEDERALYNGIFKSGDEVELTALKGSAFYHNVATAKSAVWKRLSSQHLFDYHPAMVRVFFVTFAIFVTIGLNVVLVSELLGTLAAFVTGIVIFAAGWFMPRRTQDGIKLYAEIKGFEWFLRVTDKDRLDFHNAPQRTPEQFMEFLPYAIAFGVEQAWAKQFAGIEMKPPSWAEGSGWNAMNSVAFASNLNTMSTKASASIYSAPQSSSGGGMSGGGFGGGGGGSW